MRIAVDAMGGDHAPLAAVEGAVEAVRELGVSVVLVGRRTDIEAALGQLGLAKPPDGSRSCRPTR
jgi:glycerol-3-phosphate acyltransferase PlsX